MKLLSLLILTLLPLNSECVEDVERPDIEILIMNYSDNGPDLYYVCKQSDWIEICTEGKKIEDRWK